MINPWGCTGKKDTSELRPYIDPTITGVNAAMAPINMRLPTVTDVLPYIGKGWCLAKRDWRHGFHHLTVDPAHRPYLGFRISSGEIGRWRALPFGVSQAPAYFTEVAVEFVRLLALSLPQFTQQDYVIAQYVDDCFIAARTFDILQTVIAAMDVLAESLGVEFKPSKDEGTT